MTRPARRSFAAQSASFFLRGLGTLLPTILTIGVLWWVFDFLWNAIGWYLIELIKQVWFLLQQNNLVDPTNASFIRNYFEEAWFTKPLGVLLALLLIYLVGLLVGNFLGRALYAGLERLVLRVPVVRAVYPTFKQITDFILSDREKQFAGSRVVACRPHSSGIWSIALVTGDGVKRLAEASQDETITLFVPSSPTAFSGYVMVAPRKEVVELPMTVEEAMKLLVSGGVAQPGAKHAKLGKKDASAEAEPAAVPAASSQATLPDPNSPQAPQPARTAEPDPV